MSCQEIETQTTDPLQEAILNGIIMGFIDSEQEEIEEELWFDIIYPEYARLEETISISVRVSNSSVERLTFRGTNGKVELHTATGRNVQEGDLLATLSNEDLMLLIELTQAENRLEQYENSIRTQEEHFRARIEDARANNSGNEESAILLEMAEIDYEIFRMNRDDTLHDLRTVVSDLRLSTEGENMYAPFDGQIIRTIADGTFIEGRTQIITISNMSDFVLTASWFDLSHVARNFFNNTGMHWGMLRFGDIVSIESQVRHYDDPNVPLLAFDAMVVTDVMGASRQNFDWNFVLYPIDKESLIAEVEALEIPVAMFNNMYFRGEITVKRLPQSLTLPRYAVGELGDSHFVTVHDNGTLSRRFVQLGFTNFPGVYEIISGIDIDTEVVVLR